MSDSVDQEARDLAREAISDIRQHAAVCIEARKNDERFQSDVRQWLERIEHAYDRGQRDMESRLTGAVEKQRIDGSRDWEGQNSVNRDLYARFWGLAIGGISLLLTMVGALLFVVAKLEHWM